MRLAETNFGAKKEYLVYFKDYLKALKEKLGEDKNEKALENLPKIQKPLLEILKGFKVISFIYRNYAWLSDILNTFMNRII